MLVGGGWDGRRLWSWVRSPKKESPPFASPPTAVPHCPFQIVAGQPIAPQPSPALKSWQRGQACSPEIAPFALHRSVIGEPDRKRLSLADAPQRHCRASKGRGRGC